MGDSQTARKFSIAGCYVAFLAFACFLLFYHLDNHLLWGDEGETAVLAKNVAQFGVPRTFDGTNYILLHGRRDETRDHVWIWSPWLQEYLAASAFIVLGPTTWAARAPFALIGWCSLVALALIAYKIYRSHWVALASAVLLGTSEVFLLHARQCRYYSISVFAEILLVYGIHQLLAQNRRGIWLAALALVLQFYSNYIMVVANLPGLLVLAWMLRKQGKSAVLGVSAVPGILFVAALPWLVYAHPWGQTSVAGGENYFRKAWEYLMEFHFHFIPLCFLLLPLLGFIPACRDRPTTGPEVPRRWERLLLLWLPLYFVTIVITPGFYLRYLLPLLPVACLLAAAWIFRHVKWRALAALVVAVLALSNAFSLVTACPFREAHTLRFPLVEYGEGLAAPYTDRFADVLDFFKSQAHPGEKVLTFDPDFPLMFYTQLVVIDGHIMGPPEGQLPDWILPNSASGVVAQESVALPEFLRPHYEMITIPVHDSVQAGSVPEPDIYQYRSVPARVPFTIYKLRPAPDPKPTSPTPNTP
ncbi:MAG: glycosyltransferase family 39 protein [Verrucomicrobiota bacterium]|jgi:4-amino-4-deoxy-L-arabinose transferase-like glycosyltransferase